MTPPIFLLDGFSSAGIYASPSSMSIKIKENSEIECKVDIQKEVFGQLNLKIQATTDEIVKVYRKPVIFTESVENLALFQI
jgi:hypothetical protein